MSKTKATSAVLLIAFGLPWSVKASIVGTYVDAVGGGGGNTVNSTTSSATDWFTSPGTTTDNLWRSASAGEFGGVFAAVQQGGDIWESYAPTEDSPQITTTITGLNPGGQYKVYVIYDVVSSHFNNSDWKLQAGLAGNALTVWDDTTGFVTATADIMDEREGLLGIATASPTGTIAVNINDNVGSGYIDFRSWYDGVAYEAAVPEPSTALLLGVGGLLLWRRSRQDA